MLLRNKKTGEVIGVDNIYTYADGKQEKYNSLKEFIEEWEDYEEPKDFWFIDPEVLIACESTEPLLCDKKVAIETMKQIGNYFDTREEVEKAVEKLKAWKRLKDKGFKFDGWSAGLGKNKIYTIFWSHNDGEFDLRKDLDLLFGGEE